MERIGSGTWAVDNVSGGLWMVLLKRLYFVPDDGSTVTSIAATGNFAFGGLVGDEMWVHRAGVNRLFFGGMTFVPAAFLPAG